MVRRGGYGFNPHPLWRATVRTIKGGDGEPRFVAADVIAVLGIGNITDALGRLDDDEKGFDSIETLGGLQRMTVVNESGLYSLILGSRKPEAKRFKRGAAAWMTSCPQFSGQLLPAFQRARGLRR